MQEDVDIFLNFLMEELSDTDQSLKDMVCELREKRMKEQGIEEERVILHYKGSSFIYLEEHFNDYTIKISTQNENCIEKVQI